MSDGTRYGKIAGFPQTRYSAVRAVASADASERSIGFDKLCAVYWKPVYSYLRLKWRKERDEAQDLAQQFFVHVLEKNTFAAFDPRKSRFRTFVRLCLDHFVANELKAAARIKRGGEARFVPLETEDEDGELRRIEIADDTDIEAEFDRAWLRGIFAVALSELRAATSSERRQLYFTVFERYDIQRDEHHAVTYDQLARDYNLPVTQITNYLSAMRRRFRSTVLEKLREVTGSDEEFVEEAQAMLGLKIER